MKRLFSISTLFILCSVLINYAFLTNALAASPPIILITSPSDGAILGTGLITVTGSASDPTGIQKVEVSVDGSAFSLATGTTSWSFTTGVLSSGPHTIVAKATNNAGITSVPVGINPQAVAVNPTTNTIYVTSYYANPISVINGATNTVVSTIPSGSNAQQIAVNPTTNTIYVANFESNSISVINGIKNTVKSTITGLNGPLGVAVNPTTNTVYASNYWSNSISVINGATNTVTDTILGIDSPSKIAVNPTTNTVYISNQNSASVTAINGATNVVTSTIPLLVGSHPAYITVNPTTNTIYVTNGNPADSISVINGATNTVTTTIPVEIQPNGITVNPTTNTIYVTNLQSNSVSVINGATNTVTTTIPVETYPNSIAVNPTTNTVYVSNQVSNSVSVINGITAIPETASTSISFTIDITNEPKIEIYLDADEIAPEIVQPKFEKAKIIEIPGAPKQHTHKRIEIDGGQVNITVKVTNVGISNRTSVLLTFEPDIQTGGHNHTVPNNFKSAFGGFDVKKVKLESNGTTNNDGVYHALFTAKNFNSEYSSAAGNIMLKATMQLPNIGTMTTTKMFTIKVHGLEALPEGDNYDLVGSVLRDGSKPHPDNHYGTSDVNLILQKIANDYQVLHMGDIIKYNDMSLVNGGVFDLNLDFNPAIGNGGHKSHACGTDIDVGIKATNGHDINKTQLAVLVKKYAPDGFVYSEGNHWHIHFEDCW